MTPHMLLFLGFGLGVFSAVYGFTYAMAEERPHPMYVEMVWWRRPWALFKWNFWGYWWQLALFGVGAGCYLVGSVWMLCNLI